MNSEEEENKAHDDCDHIHANKTIDIETARKASVPRWIKVFGWIFIVLGGLIPIGYTYFLVSGTPAAYSIYGLRYYGPADSPWAIGISVLIVLTGIAAYGLLFGRDWGLKFCIALGYVGLLISISGVFVSGYSYIPFEPFVMIPYLMKLHKLRNTWHGLENV